MLLKGQIEACGHDTGQHQTRTELLKLGDAAVATQIILFSAAVLYARHTTSHYTIQDAESHHECAALPTRTCSTMVKGQSQCCSANNAKERVRLYICPICGTAV